MNRHYLVGREMSAGTTAKNETSPISSLGRGREEEGKDLGEVYMDVGVA